MSQFRALDQNVRLQAIEVNDLIFALCTKICREDSRFSKVSASRTYRHLEGIIPFIESVQRVPFTFQSEKLVLPLASLKFDPIVVSSQDSHIF